MGLFNDKQESIFEFSIDETAKAYLLETARWGKFLAIVSIVSISLVLIVAIGTLLLGQYEAIILLSSYGAVALFYVYPIWALYKFSALSKQGIITLNSHQFNESLRYLKGLFKYLGIATIIALVFAGIGLMLTVLGAFLGS